MSPRNWLPTDPRTTARRPRTRLAVESLEDRSVPTGFSFPDFASTSALTLVGDAAVTADNRLRLTPAAGSMEGAAWFSSEKQFVGTAFETTFQFQLTDSFDAPGGSDGFVFILQNTGPTFLGGGGGNLGYDGLGNSLAIEFDTFQNSELGDPSHSHISIHTNGTGPNRKEEAFSIGRFDTSPALLDDGAVHVVKVTYAPGTLSVFLDDMATPKITSSVDLAELLGIDAGKAWVGFTSTTGGGYQNHDILNWSYTTGPDVETTVWVNDASALEGNSGASNVAFTITREGDTSNSTTVNWTTENRTATAGSDYSGASGQVAFGPGETAKTVNVTVFGDTMKEASFDKFVVRLTGATGGSVADGAGIGTIVDDDSTKFFVVDDASTNRTYEHAAPGNAIRNTALNNGNSAPRGAASTAAGTTVWVVDANRKVYVYSTTGSFLGSWTANGLTQPEGITTNGTDVWIVDAATDRVYRYANAAGRRSGNQSAASSFALAATNTNAKGIVTDGYRFWVVDDGVSVDTVFQYMLAGNPKGSWAIDAANASPTGITLDPIDVRHLWIVDNGTDRVYQYDNAASRTSQSQSASTTFALAAGNTNPQDIADPPAPSVSVSVSKPDVRLSAPADVAWLATLIGRGPVAGPDAPPRPAPAKVSVAGSDTSPRAGAISQREAVPPATFPVARIAGDWLTDIEIDFRPIAVDLPRLRMGRR